MRNRRDRTAVASIVIAGVMLAAPAIASAQKLVFLVRHAERADGGAGVEKMMTGTPADPPLSPAGEARAQKLAAMLADAGIRAIYATEFKRTLDTGKPLATKLKVPLRQHPSMMAESLANRLRTEHAGDVVLVIGHSNTLPIVIKALGGPDVTIPDREYDNLFIFVPATKTLTRVRF